MDIEQGLIECYPPHSSDSTLRLPIATFATIALRDVRGPLALWSGKMTTTLYVQQTVLQSKRIKVKQKPETLPFNILRLHSFNLDRLYVLLENNFWHYERSLTSPDITNGASPGITCVSLCFFIF